MIDNETNRLSRITSILTSLQSTRLITAGYLADKFNVSRRTIYRDIKSLEKAGVPIITEEGKGYSLMEGYKVAPVMFTENEANALITAELLIESSSDESLINEFHKAIEKVKAGLTNSLKERIDELHTRLGITRTYTSKIKKSNNLLEIQRALLDCLVIKFDYTSRDDKTTNRIVEPFVVYTNDSDEWILIAHCRLRNDFRNFLLNRIENLKITTEKHTPSPISYAQYRKKVYGH